MRADRVLFALLPLLSSVGVAACSWDFGKLFERDDPQVEEARAALDGGPDADLQGARLALEEVLRFRCEADGGVDLVVDRPFASLDLGLVIFRISELVGRRFGEEEPADGATSEGDELVMAERAKQLECAHLLLQKLALDPKTPRALALRAKYLLGNLAFLARRYQDAIARYDEVLVAHPARGADPPGDAGPPQDDDAVARFAAWNRAIALERLEQDKDGGPPDGGDDTSDGGQDADEAGDGGDAGQDGGDGGQDGGDGGQDGAQDSGPPSDDGGTDTGQGAQDGGDGGAEDASTQSKPQPSAAPPPSSSIGVDLRELDRFDQKAPLDLDFKGRMRDKRKVPKKLDK